MADQRRAEVWLSGCSPASTPSFAPTSRRIPLWLKLAYTVFMAVLVPVYLRNYGPTNFLYFCDVALIITLVGIWIESPLLVSIRRASGWPR